MKIVVTARFEKDALKHLNDFQKKELASILTEIIQADSLSEIHHCKKMKGFKNAYRIRFHDFRIGFIFEGDKIKLSRLLNRKDIYKYFP